MSWYEIIAIIAIIIAVLDWFDIKPRRLVQYFIEKKTAVFYWTYLTIVLILTLYFIFVSIYLPLLGVFNIELALVLTVAAFFALGMWLPILQKQKFWRTSFERPTLWIGRLLIVAILIWYWLISLPDYLVPLILTSILIIAIFVNFFLKRKKIYMKTLNLIIYSIGVVATLLFIAVGAFVLPVVGPALRRLVYSVSRCWAPNRLGQMRTLSAGANKDTDSTNACEQASTFIVKKMNYIINVSYVFLAFYLAGLLPYFIKDKWELDTAYILLAIAAVYLLAIHLPKMEKPHFHTSFVGTMDTAFCDKHCTCIMLSPGQTCPIEIRVANTGLIYYKDCTFWVKFPEGFTILPTDHEAYKKLQFQSVIF